MNYLWNILSFILGVSLSERIKNNFKSKYDLSKSERESYEEMIKITFIFLAELKRYEYTNGKDSATIEAVLANPVLANKYFEFVNFANEFIGRSYVFLEENSYLNLKEAINTSSNFADLATNLLEAMRTSIYPSNKLKAKDNLKEFHYTD